MTIESPWKKSRKLFSPSPTQIRGMKLLVENQGVRLFLKPGKGKTAIVLKAFSILQKLGMVDCLLVLAPLRVVTTSWPQEMEKWEDFAHLKYELIHGGKTERLRVMDAKRDVYLMNVEGLTTSEWRLGPKERGYPCNNVALKFLEGKRVMLAIDESTRFKNYDTKRFFTIKKYLPFVNRTVIMTGTPRPKSLENLFSQCYLTDRGKDLGQYVTHFRNEFMMLDDDGTWKPQRTGADRVAQRIAPTTLQIREEEAVPSETINIWLPMPEDIKKKYNELRREFITSIEGRKVMAANSGVLFGKLRQLAQGFIMDADGKYLSVHDAKLDKLESLLEELDGEPAFCLYWYHADHQRISERLGYEVPRIGGGISKDQGVAYCNRFSAGDLPILLGQPQSVAHGVDGLQQSCSTIIWYAGDPSWEDTYQANCRVIRQGSTAESVTIYRIMMDCSVERAMLEIVSGHQKSEEEFCSILRSHLTE